MQESTFLALFALVLPLRVICINQLQIKRDMTKLVFWNYLELSLLGIFILKYWEGGFGQLQNEPALYVLQMGTEILLSFFLVCFLIKEIIVDKENRQNFHLKESNRRDVFIWLLVVTTFVVAIIGERLQIGILGVKAPYYPYKLESIVNHYRNFYSPFIYLLAIDYFFEKAKKKELWFSVFLFFMFTLLESVFKGSRGTFFLMVILLSVWVLNRGAFSIKKLFKLAWPLFLISLLSFPVITDYRHSKIAKKDFSLSKSLRNYSIESLIKTENYARIFGAGEELEKFVSKLGTKFKGEKISVLYSLKGAPVYHTEVIDGKVGIAHSSGVTGLGDGFIFGGIEFVFFTTIFYLIIFSIIDSNWFSFFSYALPKTLLSYWLFFTLFAGSGLWSIFMRSPFYIIIWPSIFLFCYLWRRSGALSFKFD